MEQAERPGCRENKDQWPASDQSLAGERQAASEMGAHGWLLSPLQGLGVPLTQSLPLL